MQNDDNTVNTAHASPFMWQQMSKKGDYINNNAGIEQPE